MNNIWKKKCINYAYIHANQLFPDLIIYAPWNVLSMETVVSGIACR
ncbi:hypothetical protein NIES3974_45480 [Calothrix sp. NIES-3974]|nr:hypothetical protein NIES3974_45480 [Calothrix sp. NIES-3974]